MAGRLYRSFRGRLDHLATLTRNPVRLAGTSATVPTLTQPTSTQRQVFDLIGVPIPLISNPPRTPRPPKQRKHPGRQRHFLPH